MNSQRLQLGTKDKVSAASGIVERFLSKAIAPQSQAPVVAIPYCESEHSIKPDHRLLDSPFLECREHHLGIGTPPKRTGLLSLRQLTPQVFVVIYLAIEDNDVTATRRFHGLMSCRRKIKDCQPSHAERNAGFRIRPDSGIIGPSVAQSICHAHRD